MTARGRCVCDNNINVATNGVTARRQVTARREVTIGPCKFPNTVQKGDSPVLLFSTALSQISGR